MGEVKSISSEKRYIGGFPVYYHKLDYERASEEREFLQARLIDMQDEFLERYKEFSSKENSKIVDYFSKDADINPKLIVGQVCIQQLTELALNAAWWEKGTLPRREDDFIIFCKGLYKMSLEKTSSNNKENLNIEMPRFNLSSSNDSKRCEEISR